MSTNNAPEIDTQTCDLLSIVMNTNHELKLQLEQMTEKNGGAWTCKNCGKTATLKRDILRHAETHICSKINFVY